MTVGWTFFCCPARGLRAIPPEATNRLYKNNRDGTFTDVTEKAGLKAAGWANGVCVGDYNNDGFDDIFCTYFGQNRLYRNNGNGTFTDVTKEAGLLECRPARWGAGCAFVDYNRDGHLDLFVSNYIRFSLEHAPAPGRTPPAIGKESRLTADRAGCRPAGTLSTRTTAMERSLT